MVVRVDPKRRIENHRDLEKGMEIVVAYQRSWTSDVRLCHGTIVGVLGPDHDKSFVLEPDDSDIASITVHRTSSCGTIDGESVHDIAALEPSQE